MPSVLWSNFCSFRMMKRQCYGASGCYAPLGFRRIHEDRRPVTYVKVRDFIKSMTNNRKRSNRTHHFENRTNTMPNTSRFRRNVNATQYSALLLDSCSLAQKYFQISCRGTYPKRDEIPTFAVLGGRVKISLLVWLWTWCHSSTLYITNGFYIHQFYRL